VTPRGGPVETEVFGEVAAELVQLTTRLMRALEPGWPPLDSGGITIVQCTTGQLGLEVGDALYTFALGAGTIVERRSWRVRLIGEGGVLEQHDLIRPDLN
jgi:hypothetical protein